MTFTAFETRSSSPILQAQKTHGEIDSCQCIMKFSIHLLFCTMQGTQILIAAFTFSLIWQPVKLRPVPPWVTSSEEAAGCPEPGDSGEQTESNSGNDQKTFASRERPDPRNMSLEVSKEGLLGWVPNSSGTEEPSLNLRAKTFRLAGKGMCV